VHSVVAALTALTALTLGDATVQATEGARHGDGAVVEGRVGSIDGLRDYWTARKMRRARALPVVQLASPSDDGLQGSPGSDPRRSYVPAARPGGTTNATRHRGRIAPAKATKVRGTDTGDPTAFPNSANGVVYGEYRIAGQDELYRCSGSVINTDAGDVVLTSGHCVIDAATGVRARNLVFVPGYRNGRKPFGEWTAARYATTAKWRNTAGTGHADEAGDIAMLTLDPRSGTDVQSAVGALGIGFHQARNRVYTEYGYPAKAPYDGSRLFARTARYAGADNSFSPPTMGIVSDFTGGSSGGPWVAGSSPVALSVTDYSYVYPPSLSDYMFGPYFGTVAQRLYQSVGGSAQGSKSTSTAPLPGFSIARVIRHPRRGTATIAVSVRRAGALTLTGSHVKSASRRAGDRGRVALPVVARGRFARHLRRSGRVRVGAHIRFVADDTGPSSKYRRVTLSKRAHHKRHARR
jgi:V8-like Glu-specific endopeptidase